jgi:hypothetical protein
MILRRFSEALKQQNWSAIAIEFVLLVLGVFLGIQVANWNEARLEERRARGFLERLSGDLDQELASIDKRVAYVGRSIAYGEAALEWVESGTFADGSAWQTVLAFVQASRILPYSPVDSTYQEMRSAGELGLVRDASLRTALTEYFVSGTYARADYILRLNPEYRRHVRGLTPYRIGRHIATECFDMAVVTHKPCASPVDEAAASDVLRRYAEDPTLVAELTYWLDSAHQKIEILGQLRVTCVELRQRIDAELGRSPRKDIQ